jgi:hypothetical protein
MFKGQALKRHFIARLWRIAQLRKLLRAWSPFRPCTAGSAAGAALTR